MALTFAVLFIMVVGPAFAAFEATDKVPTGVLSSFDYKNSTAAALGKFGGAAGPTATQLPGQVGSGMSTLFVTLEPCSILLPHNHPRAAETFFVVEGTFHVGQVDEFMSSPGGLSNLTLTAGQGTIFPQGLLHYQQNLDCTPASFYSTFNSENSGTQFFPDAFFALPDEAVAAALGLSSVSGFQTLKSSTNPPTVFGPSSASACLAKCGAAAAPAKAAGR